MVLHIHKTFPKYRLTDIVQTAARGEVYAQNVFVVKIAWTPNIIVTDSPFDDYDMDNPQRVFPEANSGADSPVVEGAKQHCCCPHKALALLKQKQLSIDYHCFAVNVLERRAETAPLPHRRQGYREWELSKMAKRLEKINPVARTDELAWSWYVSGIEIRALDERLAALGMLEESVGDDENLNEHDTYNDPMQFDSDGF